MRKLLKKLHIVQEVSNKGRTPVLGRGFSTAHRLNPWNPLSYITLVVVIIVGLLLFGFIGIWKEIEMGNPFKWN